jgi:hypothetical protein
LIGELENRNEEKSKSKITLIGVIFWFFLFMLIFKLFS